MPQAKRKFIETHDVVDAVAPSRAPVTGSVATLTGEIDWAASPARAMHDQLLRVFGTEERVQADGWSPRAKVAFVGAASLGLWALIGLAVAAVF